MAAIRDLPDPPGPDRPTTLEADTLGFLLALKNNLVPDVSALATYLAAAASPAIFIACAFDGSSIADGNPGAGGWRVNNAAQNAASFLYASTTDGLGVDVSAIEDSFDDSTSLTKGWLRLQVVGDASKWLLFKVTGAVIAAAGYRKIPVALVASSAANPFAAGVALKAIFTPNADKGDIGPTADGPHVHTQEQYANTVSGPTPTGSAWNDRNQNTVLDNLIGATFASGQVTLTVSGVYHFEADAAAFGINGNRLRVRNVTDGTTVPGAGVNSNAQDLGSGFLLGANPRVVTGRVTIVAPKTFALQHYMQSSNANGLGKPLSTGDPEVMSDFRVYKH